MINANKFGMPGRDIIAIKMDFAFLWLSNILRAVINFMVVKERQYLEFYAGIKNVNDCLIYTHTLVNKLAASDEIVRQLEIARFARRGM